jgi:hypothetical protein
MRFPGSFRGDSEYDLAGPNRQLERVRKRAQDNFSGDEAAQRALDEAAEAAAEQKRAAHRARAAQRPTLPVRLHNWWGRHFARRTQPRTPSPTTQGVPGRGGGGRFAAFIMAPLLRDTTS